MEIKKGYTSQGFGFYLKSFTTKEFCDLTGAEEPRFRPDWTTEQNALEFMRVDAIKLRLRDDYDKFLQQELKEEMFFNPLEKPELKDYGTTDLGKQQFEEDFEAWQEAEKKVIFKNVELESEGKHKFFIVGKYSFCIANNVLFRMQINSTWVIITKLSEIFYHTKGELELKNVII